MYKMLVIGLFTACLVNAASLIGHLAAFPAVTAGHSGLKNGVASLAYDPAVHAERPLVKEALAYRQE